MKEVKTMSINGSTGASIQPNYFSEKENSTVRNEETLFPKLVFLQRDTTSPSLQKKVTTSISEPILEQGEIGYTPLKFRVISKQTQSIQIDINSTAEKIKEITQEWRLNKDSKHRLNEEVDLRAFYITSLLAKSKLARIRGTLNVEKDCIELAQKHLSMRLKDSYFHGDIQFAVYMDKAYPEIKAADLVNMNVLRDLLLTLRRATILKPDHESPSSKELVSINEFLPKHWKALMDQGKLTENDNQLLNENLKHFMSEDPFKDEFIKHPELFKQVKDAPSILLQKYPHLASVKDFLSKDPIAGWIELPNQTFDTENLKLCISKAKTSPLARTLNLYFIEPSITPSHAYLIKNLIVERQDLTVLLGNEEDLATIMMAFYDDLGLVFNKMKTFLVPDSTLDKNRKAFLFTINPESPVIRVQPCQIRSTDSSSKSTLKSTNERLYLLMDREDGKVLAVKENDLEHALKLDRKYVDKNGITREWGIVVINREDYKRADILLEQCRKELPSK